jgi:hypothetical protein
MADIQEIPVEKIQDIQNNAAEIENIQNNAAENENIQAETENTAEIVNNAAAPKKRGRPKGALNKKKPTQPVQPVQPVQPPRLAQPVQPAQPTYFSPPPPVDPTAELLGMLRQGMARQREHRVAKYASWVQRF